MNDSHGCKVTDVKGRIEVHQKICPFRYLFCCRIGCAQKLVQLNEYLDHVLKEHEMMLWPSGNDACEGQIYIPDLGGPPRPVPYYLLSVSKDTKQCFLSDYVTKDNLYLWVTCLASKGEVGDKTFSLTIFGGSFYKLSYVGKICSVDCNPQDILESEALKLPMSNVKRVMCVGSKKDVIELKYTLQIL